MSAIVKKSPNLFIAKLLGYSGLLIMSSFIIYATIYGDFYSEGAVLMSMPWGIVSLVDIYLGLIIFCCWVYWREKNKNIALLWTVSILLLGNMISCLYILKSAYESDGSLNDFLFNKDKASDFHAK